jgi:hypothetical protein
VLRITDGLLLRMATVSLLRLQVADLVV